MSWLYHVLDIHSCSSNSLLFLHIPGLLPHLNLVPRYTILKLDALPSKNIQRTTNRQIHFTLTQLLNQLQISDAAASTRIGYWDRAPFGEFRDEGVVDAGLEAFDVGSVDQELGTMRFEEGYGFYSIPLATVGVEV